MAVPKLRHYNFGVEIEAVVKPYGGADSFTNVDWYRQLAQKLRNRNIEAVHDDCSKYSKHPEYYGGKWFVTRDGSLKRERPMVCMEVVSPRLDTKQHVSGILGDFWEAMRVHFSPQRDISCGGHVHVTPVSGQNKFSLRGLKKIAFASAVYEEFVAAVLPKARRENQYCRPNSQSMGSGLRETLIRFGKSKGSLIQVASEIKSTTSEMDLCYYMQGNRYVLWNFQNIFPNPKTGKCTGTVEFRGGNQFLSTKGTLAWVAFVMGFITLALEEDLLNKLTTYTSPDDPKFQARLEDWWKRIRQAAKQSKLSRYLPLEYIKMHTR
ncbi:SWIM zinc finger protein [Fusarium globosum]|uniref:SWIM zinc finger protein n=1 Tax=Fusarium globosum TaxID=78864 RepID=A0A8H5YSF1_9HYPO|nr:SWIM zinc finger protein [Fusarium globosum]